MLNILQESVHNAIIEEYRNTYGIMEDMDITHAEIVSALEKIPTDAGIVSKGISEWERMGDSSQLASICLLTLTKLHQTELSVASELKKLRESLEDVRYVTTTKLACKLQQTPEFREGFSTVVTDEGDIFLTYNNSRLQKDMYEGYDRLHYKLRAVYGYKEITYKTLNNALLKSFNWTKEEVKNIDETEKAMVVLSKAEYLLLLTRKKKVTIPEIKKSILPYVIETKEIKQILLDAGWITIQQGTCKTLFFTQPAFVE